MPSKDKKKGLSDAQMKQRQEASQVARHHSTGPKTEEGKRASSKNAWKTGQHAQRLIGTAVFKPCKSTCPEHPCQFVTDGETKPGGNCLDRRAVVMVYDAICAAIQDKSMEGINEVIAANVAANIGLLQEMRTSILEKGPFIEQPMTNKEGDIIGHVTVMHPGIMTVIKLSEQIGLSLPEMLATPAALAKATTEEKATQSAAEFLRQNKMTIPGVEVPDYIEAEVVKDD